MKKEVLISLTLIALLVFYSGCNEEMTVEDLQKIPEAKEFLEEYPDALVKISHFSVDKFKTMRAYAPSSCKAIPENSYFKIMLVSGNAILYIYTEEETLSVACSHWAGGDECHSSEECDDKDPTTKSVCSGTPKKCSFELKTCWEQKGDNCTPAEECAEQFIKSADSDSCCPEKCTGREESGPCENILCNENEKCDNGTCRLKTCGEFNGVKCEENEFCVQAFISTLDSDRCCPIACSDADPCDGVKCAPHLKCVGGKCESKNCDERGGYECVSGEICSEGFISSADSTKCCPNACKLLCGSSFCGSNQKCVNHACRIFTCAEMSGMVCPGSTECDKTEKNSFDQTNCCVGNCVHPEVQDSVFDIELLGIVIVDETPCDDTVTIKAKFRNNGEKIDLTAEADYVKFEIYIDGYLTLNNASKQVIEESEEFEINLEQFSVKSGNHFTVAVLADSDNAVNESNESNNSDTRSLEVGMDFSIETISATETGNGYALCAKIIASGKPYRTENPQILYYFNGAQVFDEDFEGACVNGNNSFEECVDVSTNELENGENEFKVAIDPQNFAKESNESNNQATTTTEIEGSECTEATEATDCDDQKDYTADLCVEETCTHSFIEGTDCSVFSDITIAEDCFGLALLGCNPATYNFDWTLDFNSVFSVQGSNGDQCTTRWEITDIKRDSAIVEEGMISDCTHSISVFNEEAQTSELGGTPESVAYLMMLLYHILGANESFCQGTLVDRINSSCAEICGFKGFGFGTCMTDEAKSIYQECSYGEPGYFGGVSSCAGDGTYYACCCAATEEDMLIPSLGGDLYSIGEIGIGINYLGELREPDCQNSQDLYFTVQNTSTQTVEDVEYKLYIDDELVESGSYFADVLERVTDDWPYNKNIPEGQHIMSVPFEGHTPGKTIKIVIDPNDKIKETDETNNVIETTFSSEKMDLSFFHQLGVYGDLFITLTRDKILNYCPPFEAELYVNGVQEPVNFYGFTAGTIEEILIGGPELSVGEHEIRVVIDPENKVDESDESNNDVTFSITVEEPA